MNIMHYTGLENTKLGQMRIDKYTNCAKVIDYSQFKLFKILS